MGRSRYLITEVDQPHFMTCTVIEWLPVFIRPEIVQIILDSWQYLREHQGLKLYGFVVILFPYAKSIENHLHFVAQAPELDKCVHNFKFFTARKILDYLKDQHITHLLNQFKLT